MFYSTHFTINVKIFLFNSNYSFSGVYFYLLDRLGSGRGRLLKDCRLKCRFEKNTFTIKRHVLLAAFYFLMS